MNARSLSLSKRRGSPLHASKRSSVFVIFCFILASMIAFYLINPLINRQTRECTVISTTIKNNNGFIFTEECGTLTVTSENTMIAQDSSTMFFTRLVPGQHYRFMTRGYSFLFYHAHVVSMKHLETQQVPFSH